MSSTRTGAASAAPTLDQLADGIRLELQAIEGDNRSALTHAIAAGEKLNQAKAQLKHGQWYPWLDKNFDLSHETARQYMLLANHKHACDFNSIREALAAIPKKKRKASSRSQASHEKAEAWENDEVLAWVNRRFKAGRTRNEVHRESAAGEHDWPLPGESLSQNGVDIARHILRDRKRRGDNNRRRQPSEGGKRLRELHTARRNGRSGSLWELQKAIAVAVSELEFFALPELGWDEETETLIEEIYDDLGRHARWNDEALDVVTAHMNELGRQRKIHMLQQRADDPSSTQAERMTAARLAERLRRKANAKQLAN
jgi:Protein of unknown function (DUF3102)